MGRSVSYPAGAIVAYRALECENDDDWEWVYEDLGISLYGSLAAIWLVARDDDRY